MPAGEDALKIGELARRARVPVATVKYYLREGLVPVATKTHRNMAYYPPEAVERIRLVKELQEKRFLPIRVIKSILGPEGRAAGSLPAMHGTLSEAAERALAGSPGSLARKRAAEAAGITARELAGLEADGVVARRAASESYDAIDARILAILGELRAAGFTRARGFGAELLARYKRAVDALAADEVALFLEKVLARVPAEEATAMLALALERIGEVIALLRRKALASAVEELERAADGARTKAKEKMVRRRGS